jgi:hypothetical protein
VWSIDFDSSSRRFAISARSALKLTVTLLALLLASGSLAQSPADWMKRILDPAKIGVAPPAGATLNRKLTVDYLSKQDPPAEMAIYLLPLDQLHAASDHFKQTLGVTPETSGSGEYEINRFAVPAKNLTIMLAKSQFVDDKLQITMTYMPPAK